MTSPRAVVLLSCLLAFAAPDLALAEGGGGGAKATGSGDRREKMAKRPRDEADLTGGEMIQLEPMWVPVMNRGRGPVFYGITVQLTPQPDKIPDACYKTPWVTEALVLYFHDHPLPGMTQATLESAPLARALKGVVEAVAPGLFKAVHLIEGSSDKINENDADLSLSCG
ncbi:hypothetical protein [Pararhodospirillum photometricum]|nr:hypothetical protein [Pararhodospirillum photometricum]